MVNGLFVFTMLHTSICDATFHYKKLTTYQWEGKNDHHLLRFDCCSLCILEEES